MKRSALLSTLVGAFAIASPLCAQSFPSTDPVLRTLWTEGMDNSRLPALAQVMLDSIGPRLTGTPGIKSAGEWLVKTYSSWGILARNERYGTWVEWQRGPSHIDLVTPRVRTLEGGLLAWSPGTGGRDVTGPVILLPDLPDSAAYAAWYPQVRNTFVLLSYAEPTCRPDEDWIERAAPGSFGRMDSTRTVERAAWTARVRRTGFVAASGLGAGPLGRRLGEAGALGVITLRWDNRGWGTRRVFGDLRQVVPAIDLSCEDYGLVARLAANNQGPSIRLRAEAEHRGEQPVFNTIAEIRGSQLPDEYVVLSAHFDSFDAGSGATDNGTGTLIMLEAMRLLRRAYPNPKRTIIAGHWSSEEQGLNGSRAFTEDHPEVVRGVQAVFNQDNGTGRIQSISAAGFLGAGARLATWLSKMPEQISGEVRLSMPGSPSGGGSDDASFLCHGAPAFFLGASDWNYGAYTWHTNRDTFDKVVLDDLKRNATLTAMLAYLAADDPERVPRDRRAFDIGDSPTAAAMGGRGGRGGRGGGGGRGGRAGGGGWPACTPAIRTSAGYNR